MPYRHTLIFDDSLNMLWKSYAERATVDYRFNRTVKGSAEGSAEPQSSARAPSLQPSTPHAGR